MSTAEVLSQGDEVVTGQIVDTNTAWLADRLTALGFDVVSHRTVGDRLDDIVACLRTSAADLVVCTGGLGPTEDDLTSAAVARAFDLPLELDEAALAWLEARYAAAGRRMASTNRKQVMFPRGALRLDNARGTAPGFAITPSAGRWMAFMPGVPSEMRHMFEHVLLPEILGHFEVPAGRLVTLRTCGAGESVLQERIGSFVHPRIVLAYRTSLRENQIKLRVPHDVSEAELRRVVVDLRTRIGTSVFAVDGLGEPGGALPEVVGRALVAAGATLAVAESCTGGRIASLATEVPGSSAWFLEGVVTYANAAKVRLLGVSASEIASHGAVSEPVARAMAEGARARSGATYALATTGIAGPGGGSEAKPVGTVHFALATPEGTWHRHVRLPGDRERVQALAAISALDALRRHLQGVLPL